MIGEPDFRERVIRSFESIDTRVIELRERQDRVQKELRASIEATRSAIALISAELARLSETFGAPAGARKSGKNVSENGDKDDAGNDTKNVTEKDDENPDNDDAKPPVTPSEPAPPKRRHRFL